jgi:hypothetical protein
MYLSPDLGSFATGGSCKHVATAMQTQCFNDIIEDQEDWLLQIGFYLIRLFDPASVS